MKSSSRGRAEVEAPIDDRVFVLVKGTAFGGAAPGRAEE